MARAHAASACVQSDSIKGLAQSIAKPAYHRLLIAEPVLRRAVPTLIINARNDPFMPGEVLPTPGEVSPLVTLDFPESGGHVGFVSGAFPGYLGWLSQRLLDFFDSQR